MKDKTKYKMLDVYNDILKPSRYKVLHGGRLSGKTFAFANRILDLGMEKPIYVMCLKKNQQSIKESLYSLLKLLISKRKLSDFYIHNRSNITGKNGTMIFFKDLTFFTKRLKCCSKTDTFHSKFDIVWLDDLPTFKEEDFKLIDNKIDKKDSELWFSFNPNMKKDYLYDTFITKKPPADSVVIKTTYKDNSCIDPSIDHNIISYDKECPDLYGHIWLGEPRPDFPINNAGCYEIPKDK